MKTFYEKKRKMVISHVIGKSIPGRCFCHIYILTLLALQTDLKDLQVYSYETQDMCSFFIATIWLFDTVSDSSIWRVLGGDNEMISMTDITRSLHSYATMIQTIHISYSKRRFFFQIFHVSLKELSLYILETRALLKFCL